MKEGSRDEGRGKQNQNSGGKGKRPSKRERVKDSKEEEYVNFIYEDLKEGLKDDSLPLSQMLNNSDSETSKITNFLYSEDFKKVLLEFYSILPAIITRDMIKEFINETNSNQGYATFINEWRNLNQMKKLH